MWKQTQGIPHTSHAHPGLKNRPCHDTLTDVPLGRTRIRGGRLGAPCPCSGRAATQPAPLTAAARRRGACKTRQVKQQTLKATMRSRNIAHPTASTWFRFTSRDTKNFDQTQRIGSVMMEAPATLRRCSGKSTCAVGSSLTNNGKKTVTDNEHEKDNREQDSCQQVHQRNDATQQRNSRRMGLARNVPVLPRWVGDGTRDVISPCSGNTFPSRYPRSEQRPQNKR